MHRIEYITNSSLHIVCRTKVKDGITLWPRSSPSLYFTHKYEESKEIEYLSQTQILYLWNLMLYTFDISNYIGIRKSEFVSKTQFLSPETYEKFNIFVLLNISSIRGVLNKNIYFSLTCTIVLHSMCIN